MNEEQYQALGSPPLEPADVGFRLRTTCGALMPGMGFLSCNLQIGKETYKQQFIVCRQLTPGIILGRDFLSRNQLWITWGPEGILQLRDVFQDPQLARKYTKHLDKKVQVDSSVSQEPKIVPDPESSTDTQY